MSNIASNAWLEHNVYSSIDSEADLQDFVRSGNIQHVINPLEYIADDLFELRHPELMHDDSERADFVKDITDQGASFGNWVHYPWISAIVQVADATDHYDLRTYRNHNLITKSEQDKLHLTRVAAFGLSVGSNVVDRTVQSGIGNEYLLFDYDRLSPTNLNRIQAGLAQVGLQKTTIAGRKIAELDPYVSQQHFTTGYDRNTDDILRANRPDIIIEEVDNLEVKARLRRIAAELGVPLVMAGDVGDRSTLDIERHDLGEVLPFNGKLTQQEMDALLSGQAASMSKEMQTAMLVKMLGPDNISASLFQSVGLTGKELAGTPQLGTTAALGGAVTAVAIREILLDHAIKSNANVFDAAEFTGAPASLKISDMRKLN